MRSSPFSLVLCCSLPVFGQTLTVLSSTTGQSGPLAPESIVAAYGSNLSTGTAECIPPLGTSLAGTTVGVTDSAGTTRLANLFYVSPRQVNFEIPAGTALGNATVTVTNQAGAAQTAVIQIANVSPGIFELNSSGLAAAWALQVISGVQNLLPVYQVNSGAIVASPLDLALPNEQLFLEMYGTGIRNASKVNATVGGQNVPVTYAGPEPVYAGLDQVNIGPLPASLSGVASIILTADGVTANTVNVAILASGASPLPIITAIAPPATAAGGASFTLTVNGKGFVPGATVEWNGSAGQPPIATSWVSPTQLTATIPAADIAFAGSASVTVVNPAPGGGPSAPAVLAITGVIPSNVAFVAPTGNDSNRGTIDQPWLTIQKCASNMTSGGTCSIRAGTYYETVKPNSGITIASYNGEPVTVDGTDAVTGWTLYHGSIYRAPTVLSTGDTNQVFANGQMMTEARWPNGDDLFNVNWATAQTGTTASQIVDFNLPGIDWTGAKVHLWSGIDPWSNQTGTVTASQAGHITFSLDDACLSTYICPAPGGYYYLFGVLGALDAEQEWYYDSSANTLYFWAPGGVNPNILNVRAKQRQYAFDLSGVSNVAIRNIGIFASAINMNGSSANNVLEGLNVQYASHFTALPAAVGLFTNAHFTDSGIIINGTGNTLQNSTVAYSAGAGVVVVGSGNSLRNNLIHHTGYMGNYASGISLQAGANTIRNNTVHTNGRFALYLCAWTSCDNDEIGYNNLFNGMILTHDGGEIYTTATVSGVRIDHNWIHDTQLHGAGPPSIQFTGGIGGVDLDNHATGFEVDQNVLWNNQVDNIGISGMGLTTPDNNNIHNNTIPDVGSGAEISLQAIQNCGTTQVADNLVLVPVDQSFEMNTPCPAIDNGPTAPGASDMTASVLVGCNFAGCSSLPPPAISGSLVAASIAIEPLDLNVSAGQTATFTVTAAGSPPLTYQWNRNGVPIAGAANTTYTTPPATSADNGAVFTVQAGNSVGSATSAPATLTVK